jgi:glycosyltransferase involved in cell wall biosynthesis
MPPRGGVLYISYDGMLEPLGQGQVITYLERLTDTARIHLISYEKPADWANGERREALRERLAAAGIVWHPLTYHKTPTVPATLFDITQGLVMALWLIVRHRLGVIHARSYVAALIGWLAKLLTGAKLLFDMRGFWADERVDGGLWGAEGRTYRSVKRIERTLLLGADHIITLTHAAKREIETWPYLAGRPHAPITVIPTCADLALFTPGEGKSEGAFTMGYVGSAGFRYEFDEVLRVYAALLHRRPQARLLIVNRNDHELIAERLAALGIDPAGVEVIAADLPQVPAALCRMDFACAFYKQLPSAVACAPTKLAEYLGCGVPCLASAGTGDVADVLEGGKVGVVMADFAEATREAAVDRMLALTSKKDLATRCREVALSRFSAEEGAARYRAIYQDLLA